MKLSVCFATIVFCGLFLTTTSNSALICRQNAPADDSKFIYSDFEKMENGRAISNGGGLIQLYTAQESTPVKFKGVEGASPGAPEIVKQKGNEVNHFALFEYSLIGPNQWANVTLEIQGKPMVNGKFTADDLSAYKNLSMQLYATGGIESVRVEVVSHGQGINIDAGFPQMALRLKPGLNTYLIPLKNLSQPSWIDGAGIKRVDTKEVLKKLTAISISAFCGPCSLQTGQIAVDNVVFQK